MFITALLDPLHHRLADQRSTPTANYYIHQELANTTKINELMRELKNTQEPSSFSLGLPPASFPLRSAAVARPLSPLWCAAAASAARGSSPPPLPQDLAEGRAQQPPPLPQGAASRGSSPPPLPPDLAEGMAQPPPQLPQGSRPPRELAASPPAGSGGGEGAAAAGATASGSRWPRELAASPPIARRLPSSNRRTR
ncbi:hypothetical protein OsJ_07623 [Oryza sativa Japonica Group]|uniref:Uncharacterized protein n=1 Tax=Oryza sativa subsp. japonica TaxID=39947 RepID=B9F183_ORYSJ|nr:hypothetical protein OsJ_07623 [Oryza sativa Japonica Group]